MITIDLDDLASLLDADRAGWDDTVAARVVRGVATDSREVVPGDVYVARRGEAADGADFAGSAVDAGAVAVVADRPLAVPTLVVPDAQAALVAMATAVRDRCTATVVGITGSVGKTTTKDLLAAVAGATRTTVAAHGSFNNEVGVPLTVCRADEATQVLVAELGARGRGHIASLTTWLRPDIAVVTTVAGAHLERFRTLDEVAIAKAELVASLGPDGVAVLNADDHRVRGMAAETAARVLWVSTSDRSAAVHARDVTLDATSRASFTAVTPWGSVPVRLPVLGRHHVLNALLALAAAGEAGADPEAGAAALAGAPVSTGRARLVVARDGLVVVDDSYNANPTSVLAALDAFASQQVTGRRVAVLGVMAEIGATHDDDHRRVGSAAAAVVDHLVVVGEDAVGLADGARDADRDVVVEAVDDAEAAIAAVERIGLVAGDAVLVKASRVAALDRVVVALSDDAGAPAAMQDRP